MNSSYSSEVFIIGHPQEDAIHVIRSSHTYSICKSDSIYSRWCFLHKLCNLHHYCNDVMSWITSLWLPLGTYDTYLFIYPLDMYLYHCQFILMFKIILEKAALQIIVSFKNDTGKVSAYSMASLFATVFFLFFIWRSK